MTSIQVLQHTYTFEERALEPHKGKPCAGLDLAATKQAMDWLNSQRSSVGQPLTNLTPDKLAEYWLERWYLAERMHCLLRRMHEFWKDIPKADKPDKFILSKQKFYKDCDNAQSHALASLRRIKSMYVNNVDKTRPLGIHTSTETEEYRKEFKNWIISRRCATPKTCKKKGQCECPDLLSEHIVLPQVSLNTM